MSYWLHRISHEGELSYPLLEKGFLSVGWSDFVTQDFLTKIEVESAREYIDKIRGPNGWAFMDDAFKKHWGELSRNRYSFWRFTVDMAPGDTVLVPLYGGMFSVYKVVEKAVPVSDFKAPEGLRTSNGEAVISKNGRLSTDKRGYDLGYIIPAEAVERCIPRSGYADAALTARMKIRDTCVCIDDLEKNITEAIERFKEKKPINLYAEVLRKTKTIVLDQIKEITGPDKLEQLIAWYCRRTGASTVDIPAKNANKEGDADIIAIFEPLKLIVYIQAKFHRDITGDWAVEQVQNYRDRFEKSDGYLRIAWVISTASSFSDDAAAKAQENGVNLINGEQFAEMLINAGFAGLSI
jgi:hypothetical protein